MELFLDCANLETIRRILDSYPIDGVTTNPTILAREDDPKLPDHLLKILSLIGEKRKLFVQTTGKNVSEIVSEAKSLKTLLGDSLVLKIPMSEIGLSAVSSVKQEGITCAMTAVFSPVQALLGAKAGADYCALFVNRLDAISEDGPGTAAEAQTLLISSGCEGKILAASFRNVMQIRRCLTGGIQALTVPPDLFQPMISHSLTDIAIQRFDNDFYDKYKTSSMRDFL